MSKGFRDKVKKGLLTTVFFLVLSIGTVCLADEVPGTVLGDSCNIRETTDASGKIIGNAKKNATVSIIGEVTGNDGNQWYQVWVDGSTKGYIRADLVKKGDGTVATTTTQTTTTEAELPATQATPVDEKGGTVNTNNVRIRKGASTQHGVVATANKGMQLTVTGEASGSDGKQWYQVKFPYNNKEVVGFIRSDLVTFGSVPADTAVSEITGSQVETPAPEQQEQPDEGEPATEEQHEAVPEPEPEPQPQNNSNESSDMILMNTTDVPYIMSGFVPIILKWNDQDINAFKNGDFYIFYAQKASGEQGWYVFDSTDGTYQRYAYATEGVVVKEDNVFAGNLIPIIILVVIIVILLATVGLMFIRLKEYTSDTYENEDDEYEEEDDDDEVRDENFEEEEIEEVKEEKSQRPQRTQRPQRVQRPQRPQEMEEEYDKPVRKPMPEEQRMVRRSNPEQRPGRPVDRPQQQRRVRPEESSMEKRPERPVRRTEAGVPARRENDRPVRYQNGEPVRRRPSGEPGQRRPVRQAQAQGYRAQNFLENEDKDDIEFIDL